MTTKSATVAAVRGRYIGGGVFKPRDMGDDKRAYSSLIVLDDGEDEKIQQAITAAVKEKWPEGRKGKLEIHGAKEGDDEEFEHSFGKLFINPKKQVKADRKPTPPEVFIRRNGKLVCVDEGDDIVYPGCYVVCSVKAYAYPEDKDRKVKAGASLQLRAIMFSKDGDRLGDRVDGESEFEGFDSEEKEIEDDFDFDDDEF